MHLFDKSFTSLDPELDHHVHHALDQRPNVLARQALTASGLAHHQHQLLKRQVTTAGVSARDGAGISQAHVRARVPVSWDRVSVRWREPPELRDNARSWALPPPFARGWLQAVPPNPPPELTAAIAQVGAQITDRESIVVEVRETCIREPGAERAQVRQVERIVGAVMDLTTHKSRDGICE